MMSPSWCSLLLTCFTLVVTTLTTTHAQSPIYSSPDPSGPTQISLINLLPDFTDWISPSFTDNSVNFDALVANGYTTCTISGQTNICPSARGSVIPWSNVCGYLDYTGADYTSGKCPYVYQRSLARNDPNQLSYGAIYYRVNMQPYSAGTILNFQAHISQIFEANTNETHYLFVDFYRGPYFSNDWVRGYFDPRNDNNQTTFLFRDVIMAEPAQSYPAYTNINHNRPLPSNVSFIMIQYGVSSGPFSGGVRPHPTSIFDVRLYARPLTAGPSLTVFYPGPSPAGQTARVYIASTTCLIAGNLTMSAIQYSPSSGSVTVVGTPVLTLVQSGANQLYRVDFTFPQNVAGTVAISIPGGSVYNEFQLPNVASNVLQLQVLTQIPHLTIYSPQYPSFPAAQQSRTINYTFVFDIDVYGFDITRVGLCQKTYENDTCASSDYKYVIAGTNMWQFANGNATGTFTPDAINFKQKYELIINNLPDGAYSVRVLSTDVLSGASQNMQTDVFGLAPIRVDNVAPVITFSPVAPEFAGEFTTYADLDTQLLYTVNFSELVTGLTVPQLTVVGGGFVNTIIAIVSAPNSQDPANTWCYSTSATPCQSKYLVQVNHTGGANVRSTIVLTYTGASVPIVDLAGNALNATGGTYPAVRNGSINFSNTPTAVTVTAWPSDLETNEFEVPGLFKTNLTAIRFNFSFDYPVMNFDALQQSGNGKLQIIATQGGVPVTIPTLWTPNLALPGAPAQTTFTSLLSIPPNLITTTFNITLLANAIQDVAGDFNAQSNVYVLTADTAAPVCQSVTYPPGQDRFAGVGLHTNLTNFRVLDYTFTFNEPLQASQASAFTSVFTNVYAPVTPAGTFSFQVNGQTITASYVAGSGNTDDNQNVVVRLTNATDVFGNTQTSFANCLPLAWQFDFDAPNVSTSLTDTTPFAVNGSELVTATRYSAFITRFGNITISFQFNEYVNLTQAALKYQLESADPSKLTTTVNHLIGPLVGYNCDPVFTSFCTNFNVTVAGQDRSYSILGIDPVAAPYVTDLAGNAVSNPTMNYTYLTDQTPPTVNLSAPYPFMTPTFRTNNKLVEIDLTFSKHIAQYPGTMRGNCSNSTNTQTLQSVPLNFVGTDQTARTQFTAIFNVSQADLMVCQFYIDPNTVFDTVGNTLNGTSSIALQIRFETINVLQLYTPRGWLTNDLNPIPVCLQTDTAINVNDLFGVGGASPATYNLTIASTIPQIFDGLTGRNISTNNRTYNATTLTFCANIIPTTPDTQIEVVIPAGSLVDIYNNTNVLPYTLTIQRFDLNPNTYDNLVKDGIIQNQKLANGSVTNRNLVDGSVDQRVLANNSVGTPQLIQKSVQTIDIADGAVQSSEIAPGAVNASHLAPNAVQTQAINDSAVTNSKLAPNSVTSDKIMDGAIQTQDLANSSVTNAIIAPNAITTDRILDGAVTSSKIATGAVLNSQLANNSVSTVDIIDRNVTTQKLAVGAVTATELANGSVFHQHLTNGSVDSTVILDASIQQQDLADFSVGTNELIDGNVTNSKLSANAVTTDKILDGTIANQDLANNSVTNLNIVPFTIQWSNMANNSIDQWNLVNSAVTTRAIADRSVIDTSIAIGAIANELIAPASINTTQLQNYAVNEININNGSISSRTIIPQAVGTPAIADLAVTNAKLNDSAVDYRVIASNSIDSTKIRPGSIQSFNLAPNVVATLNYQNGSILNQFIALNAINNSQIQNGSVDTNSIALEAVHTAQLGFKSVTAEKIADGVISLKHLSTEFTSYLTNIQNSVNIPRELDGKWINDYTLAGTKLANQTVKTQQLADSAVTQSKIAENAVTYRQIAPQTINADNLGNSSVLSRTIAPYQIQRYHLAADFFSGDYLTSLAGLLTPTIQGITNSNIQRNSLDAAQVLAPGTIQNAQIGDGQVSLGKLSPTSFQSLVDMFGRLAVLEATVSALVNNIDSRCLFNVTFTNPTPAPGPTLNPQSAPQHTMGVAEHVSAAQHAVTAESVIASLPQEMQEEIKRRASQQTHEFKTNALGLTPGAKYPTTITPGKSYCGDGSGSPAGGNQTSRDNSGVVLNSAVSISPSALFVAIMAALLAVLTL